MRCRYFDCNSDPSTIPLIALRDPLYGEISNLCDRHYELYVEAKRALPVAVQEFHALALLHADPMRRAESVVSHLERARRHVECLHEILLNCGERIL